jgi:hypothetical protein
MTLVWSVMAQSGLGGQFWFSAAIIAKGARHVTNKERIKMTLHMQLHEKKKEDIAKFRYF